MRTKSEARRHVGEEESKHEGSARLPKKRWQGRPTTNGVGREALLATARRQLQELPPARVTISSIARAAGVDPALVRYYFGNREQLLLAVVEQILSDRDPAEIGGIASDQALVAEIGTTLHFIRSAKHMHRLMIDELAEAKSPEVRKRQADFTRAAIDRYARLMDHDDGKTLKKVDPLFFFIALIGMIDFFVSAEPVIRNLEGSEVDMDNMAHEFEKFVVELVLNGMRLR